MFYDLVVKHLMEGTSIDWSTVVSYTRDPDDLPVAVHLCNSMGVAIRNRPNIREIPVLRPDYGHN